MRSCRRRRTMRHCSRHKRARSEPRTRARRLRKPRTRRQAMRVDPRKREARPRRTRSSPRPRRSQPAAHPTRRTRGREGRKRRLRYNFASRQASRGSHGEEASRLNVVRRARFERWPRIRGGCPTGWTRMAAPDPARPHGVVCPLAMHIANGPTAEISDTRAAAVGASQFSREVCSAGESDADDSYFSYSEP
jgi:hypothetical protein